MPDKFKYFKGHPWHKQLGKTGLNNNKDAI